jgi:hypothetical protein
MEWSLHQRLLVQCMVRIRYLDECTPSEIIRLDSWGLETCLPGLCLKSCVHAVSELSTTKGESFV